MPAVFNSATAMNVSILKSTNSDFQTAQKRVSTGKSVFGAADDAMRYKFSVSLASKAGQLNSINNNISVALKTFETTEKTLNKMIAEMEGAAKIIAQAQAAGATSSNPRTAMTTAAISATTAVAGYAAGAVLSITSDTGQNFTYTFTRTGTTWGEVAAALSAANIGVQMDFVTSGANTFLRMSSTNGRDFTIDGSTTQTVADDLVGFAVPQGGLATLTTANAANIFANVGAAPTATETGFSITASGIAVGTKTTMTAAQAIAAGSILTFEDAFGTTRTLNYAAATTLGQVVTDINALNGGIKAEIVGTGASATAAVLRLRNTQGGNVNIVNSIGDFSTVVGITAGTYYPITASTIDNTERQRFGKLYDAAINNALNAAKNNPVQNGRNLLRGNSITVTTDENNVTNVSTITVTGTDIYGTAATPTLSILGLNQAGATWTTDALVNTSLFEVNSAITRLRDMQSEYAATTGFLKSRYDANETYASDTKSIADDLVAADVTEESAKLTALQTQQQFAVQAFSMGNQNTQGLLRMLG